MSEMEFKCPPSASDDASLGGRAAGQQAANDPVKALDEIFMLVSYVNTHGVGEQPEPIPGQPQPIRVKPDEFWAIFQRIGTIAAPFIWGDASAHHSGLPVGELNFPETMPIPYAGWAPGDYLCQCCRCKEPFRGDKRAVTCEKCAQEQFEESKLLHRDESVGELSFPDEAVRPKEGNTINPGEPIELVEEAIAEFRAVCVAEAVRLSFDQGLDGAESRAKMNEAEQALRSALLSLSSRVKELEEQKRTILAAHRENIATLLEIQKERDTLRSENETQAAALQQMKTALEEATFQPIEKLPDDWKDGRRVLLRIEHLNASYGGDQWIDYVVARWTEFNDGGWVWNGMAGHPSHFAALPALSRHPDQSTEKSHG